MSTGEPTGNFTLIKAKDPPGQGDIIKECPYLIIPDNIELIEGGTNSFNIDIYDRVTIMSNSCNLDRILSSGKTTLSLIRKKRA